MKNQKGITLIALIITIIVMLILAGVSISMVTGENGILQKAQISVEKNRAGELKEFLSLALEENEIAKYQEGNQKTKEEVVSELVEKNLLTQEEATALEDTDVITIGGVEIEFSQFEVEGFKYFGRKYLIGVGQYLVPDRDTSVTLYDSDNNQIGQIPASCVTYEERNFIISGTGTYDGNYIISRNGHNVYLKDENNEEILIAVEDGYCQHPYNEGELLNYDLSDLNNPKVFCNYCGSEDAFDCQYINGVLYSYNVEFDFIDTIDCWYRPSLNGYSALVWDKSLQTVEFESQINRIDVVEIGGFQTYTDKNTPVVTNVIFPSNVKIIKWCAFGNSITPNAACKNLENIVIPNGVITIKHNAFSYCTALSSITIPNSVQSIEDQCFEYCNLLEEIIYIGTMEEWNKIDLGDRWNYNNWYENDAKSLKIICTDGEITY